LIPLGGVELGVAEDSPVATVGRRWVMQDERHDVSSEDVSRNVARAVWGLLLIWTGAALLLHWSWGVGLLGAGTILLAAQGARRYLRVKIDGFGLVAGALLVVCGVWNMLNLALELVPLLCIGAGTALLVSIWTAKGTRRASEGRELHAHSHPRA
jgi:hypothetical protein